MHLCFNHEKNTMPGTESMHELMLSIFNIKLEASEEPNGLTKTEIKISNHQTAMYGVGSHP